MEAGRERVGRQRAMGGQSEKTSRLGKEGLECRKHSGKEEVLKAEGKNRGKMGVQGRRWTDGPREEDPGGQTEKRGG